VALTTRAIGSEEQPERVRLNGQSPSSPYFPVALIVFRWRMSREFDTIVRLSFSLLEGPSPKDAISLGQTPTASEGALLCDCLLQLHGALHTGYSNEASLFSVVIFQVERGKGHTDYSDKRCSLA